MTRRYKLVECEDGPLSQGDIRDAISELNAARGPDDEVVLGFCAALAGVGKDGWQPIESAPRDGTKVWLFCPDESPEQLVGEWIEGDGYALWSYVDACLRDLAPEGPTPTHWHPLPAPPSAKGEV